jgi:hypothetical protein
MNSQLKPLIPALGIAVLTVTVLSAAAPASAQSAAQAQVPQSDGKAYPTAFDQRDRYYNR